MAKIQSIGPDVRRASRSVIYEVNFTVDVEIIDRFDERLHEVNEAILAIPGVIAAATSVPSVSDEQLKHRCVQYRFVDQAALDRFLTQQAQPIEAELLDQFGDHVNFEQRILTMAEAALAKHGLCANCDAELQGRYCAICGQREEPRVPTMGAVLAEFTNEMFGVESKLWRSFAALLFKPGHLTSVFLAGRRQKYMSPVRLYLVFSIAAFASLALVNSLNIVTIPPKEQATDTQAAIPAEANPRSTNRANVDEESVAEAPSEETSDDDSEFNGTINVGLFSPEINAQIEERLRNSLKTIRKDIQAGNSQAVFEQFIEPLPAALFLFLPFVALLFKVLYLGSGTYYVEHLIYVLHNHAFLFAVIVMTTLSTQLLQVGSGLDIGVGITLVLALFIYQFRRMRDYLNQWANVSYFKAGLRMVALALIWLYLVSSTAESGASGLFDFIWLLYVPYYLYRSLRVVYARSRGITVATMVVIALLYLTLLGVLLVSSVIFVGYTYH